MRYLTHPQEPPRAIHPFRLHYARLAKAITETREGICAATGWSERTFYRKVTQDERLTEAEAQAVARHLNVPINEIEGYQRGYKTKADGND